MDRYNGKWENGRFLLAVIVVCLGNTEHLSRICPSLNASASCLTQILRLSSNMWTIGIKYFCLPYSYDGK